MVMAGCLSEASPAAVPQGAHAVAPPVAAKIALVLGDGMTPYGEEVDRGARAAAADHRVEVLRVDAGRDQAAALDRLVGQGLGAIVYASAAPGGSVELLDQLQRSGIPVVSFGSVPENPDLRESLPYVAVDDEQAAYLAVRELLGGSARGLRVAVLESGTQGGQALARTSGIERAIAEHPGVRVVARLSVNGRIDQAYETTRLMFASHPDVNLLIGSSDAMALGALKYLRDSRRHDVRVAGFGALPEARAALGGGGFALTVDPRIEAQAYLGVEYAARRLRGDEVPPVTLLEAGLLTGAQSRP